MPFFKKMKSTIFLVILCILASCASRKDELTKKQAELYYGAGTQSLIDQQYTEALKNLVKADELEPNNSEILNNLGMAYYFKGESKLAVKTLTRALEINPKNSDVKTNLASIYYKQGNFQQSEKLYKEVLKDLTYDKQARTYFNLGILELSSKKNSLMAEKYFKKSIKEDESYCPANYQLGLLKFKGRQFNQALKSFKDASMGTCYDTPAPHYYQALTLIELRRFDDARIKLDEIDTRFKNTIFAVKSRTKLIELNELQNKNSDSHAFTDVSESPEF